MTSGSVPVESTIQWTEALFKAGCKTYTTDQHVFKAPDFFGLMLPTDGF